MGAMEAMNAIEIRDVCKQFRIYQDKRPTLKEQILFRGRGKWEEFWALKGINLTIEKGSTVGLIGQNGSGKSTLLKLLTRIIYPDQGSINIQGKVSSLLELGAGFHPDFTGRENIYMNASIFGLSRGEINKRIKQIIGFSELEGFIDNPVRTYSSGMYMRLAFAVAINVDPDILLIDEVLAVGDAAFQKKCLDKIRELKTGGTTIVFVSHDCEVVQKLCDRAIWIGDGVIQADGDTRLVCDSYLQYLAKRKGEQFSVLAQETKESTQDIEEKQTVIEKVGENGCKRWGSGEIVITGVRLYNSLLEESHVINSCEAVTIRIDYCINQEMPDPVFGIGIFRNDGLCCYGTNTYIERLKIGNQLRKAGSVTIYIPKMNLITGDYWLDVAVVGEDGRAFDYHTQRLYFTVHSPIPATGVVRLEPQWNLQAGPLNTFSFAGRTYRYFHHEYNTTWANERAVEVPIIREMLNQYRGKRIIEVGNVLSHYFPVNHDIVDKYEQADGVINQDVTAFQPLKKYDLIVSISTLEHVGWDEEPKDPDKIIYALEMLKTWLGPNGKIAVTLPLGYNPAMDKLLKENKFQFTKQYYLKRITEDNQWTEVSWNEVLDAGYNSPFPFANALVIGIFEKK